MACMEHTCVNCGNVWFDNKRHGDCDKCGGDAIHQFDEQFDQDYEDDLEDV